MTEPVWTLDDGEQISEKEGYERIIKHMERRMQALRGNSVAIQEEMDQRNKAWGTFLQTSKKSHSPLHRDDYYKLFDLLLAHDHAIREQLKLTRKYAVANRVHSDPEDVICATWLAIIEFMDIEDE